MPKSKNKKATKLKNVNKKIKLLLIASIFLLALIVILSVQVRKEIHLQQELHLSPAEGNFQDKSVTGIVTFLWAGIFLGILGVIGITVLLIKMLNSLEE